MNGLKPPATPSTRPGLGSYGGSNSELVGRKKVTLAPGHSLMDWIRLGRAQGDLSGVSVKRNDLTLEELALHNTPDDLWMALRGKVYNLTPYIHYHPGGAEELMRAAGKDGTDLFDEIHNWVNAESMLEKCFVGALLPNPKKKEAKPKKPPVPVLEKEKASFTSVLSKPEKPSFDWYQRDDSIVVVVYTKWADLKPTHLTLEIVPSAIKVHVRLLDHSYILHFKPHQPVNDCPTVTVNNGKVEIKMEKLAKMQWPSLGEFLPNHEDLILRRSAVPQFRKWTVTSNTPVTHNTVLLRLKAPAGFTSRIPVGYHIHVVNNVSGMQLSRSYTVASPSLTKPYSDAENEAGRAIYLMVKLYPGGALSPWLTSQQPGATVSVSDHDGNFDVQRLTKVTHLVLFAAGTGFTPYIRLITYALLEMSKATFPIKLMFYNKTEKDIMWRDQLDKLATDHPRFSVTHILSQEPSNSSWTGLRGRVGPDHVKANVPAPSSTCKPLLCICGQWAYNDAVERLATLHGLKDEHIHIFAHNLN